MLVGRCPDAGIAWPEEQQAGDARRCGKVADPRVVAEVEPGSSQPSRQLGQREVLPEDNPRRGQPAQGINGRGIGFAAARDASSDDVIGL